ncbi:phosphoglycerate dehydrogenase-like enzyme [Agromyces sp. 3263]|uniref:NAD(P)-dependent oxidoreductase n=1 Tax=Agromyces sp. 3263 TaxID=2817750 RepID=UPI00285AB0A2|nr:NAD(P)-dependent oxidoreductase [Agromyces sp. 3263]MDR6907118.1 phosphoglycerate dehydrogenase-like enzyme [Agromyces sp. 3263]
MTDAASPRRPHRVVSGSQPPTSPAWRPASPGPIAVLPDGDPVVTAAVGGAGGAVAALGPGTRGIVWTAASGAESLQHALDAHPGVSWVQLPWAGVDAFAPLLARFRDDGRTWTSAKGAYAQPVAEHALMLALAVLREVPMRVRAEQWDVDERGRTLFGSDVVIVGAGGIATELLRLLAPFGVRVTVVRRRDEPVEGAWRTVGVADLGPALEHAEVVFVAAALTGETRGLIGARELQRMPHGAVLVNVARGAVVDTDALVAALASGALGGAGLDVTDPEPLPTGHPLWTAPNTIITPHVADTEAMVVPLFAERVGRNVAAFLAGRPLEGRIDAGAGY